MIDQILLLIATDYSGAVLLGHLVAFVGIIVLGNVLLGGSDVNQYRKFVFGSLVLVWSISCYTLAYQVALSGSEHVSWLKLEHWEKTEPSNYVRFVADYPESEHSPAAKEWIRSFQSGKVAAAEGTLAALLLQSLFNQNRLPAELSVIVQWERAIDRAALKELTKDDLATPGFLRKPRDTPYLTNPWKDEHNQLYEFVRNETDSFAPDIRYADHITGRLPEDTALVFEYDYDEKNNPNFKVETWIGSDRGPIFDAMVKSISLRIRLYRAGEKAPSFTSKPFTTSFIIGYEAESSMRELVQKLRSAFQGPIEESTKASSVVSAKSK
ncbi:MAG: hypothetical protein ACR2PZ_12780 [Pseudomonadales bacterium]